MSRPALLLCLWLISCAAASQATCPDQQDAAIANIAELCAEQGSGTLCFGGATVTPVFRQQQATAAPLSQPGDVIAIADIDWLSLSSEDRTWGMARALFPAYSAGDLVASHAALLAFGNVALFFPEPAEGLPSTHAKAEVTAAQGANLRARPSVEAPIVAVLPAGRELIAVSRDHEGEWLLTYAAPAATGWINRGLVDAPGESLPLFDTGLKLPPLWLAWQRFDFRSGVDDAPCDAAPESGLLLQTSKLDAPRVFVINGARVTLSGAAWLQARISSGMLVYVLDGQARVSTAGGEALVRSGNFTHVALDASETPASAQAPPTAPAAYAYHELGALPIRALPEETRVSLDRYSVVLPPPSHGGSPLQSLAADAPFKIAALLAGANMRSRPDRDAPIIAVMAYRDNAEPVARGIGADRLPWWKLAERVWVRVDATVSAGDCTAVPFVRIDA